VCDFWYGVSVPAVRLRVRSVALGAKEAGDVRSVPRGWVGLAAVAGALCCAVGGLVAHKCRGSGMRTPSSSYTSCKVASFT
jgi:hypothetical protein